MCRPSTSFAQSASPHGADVDNREIVEMFVDAFGEGRLDEALSLLHDEFVVHAAGGVPYSGDT